MHLDPHEAGVRLKPFAKNEQDEQFLQRLNQWLKDAPIPAPETTLKIEEVPLIYVVGAPRSGTTLLYQLICRYLPVGYINNVMGRFWLRPSVGIRLSRAILDDHDRETITFRSKHGVSEGPAGPHEFGYFWRHWLQLDQARTHHLSEKDLKRVDQIGLKHALEKEIIGAFHSSVAFKNVICGFHASFLTRLHPASIFVSITRDTYATAASILKTRKERYGSYSSWWSLKPSTYPFNTTPGDAVAEVVSQVIDCRREFEQELSHPGVRACFVSYEGLCENPEGVLLSICQRVQEYGVPLSLVNREMPKLQVTSPPPLPEDLDCTLRQELERSRAHSHGG